jgi:hypothetical protein
MPSGGSRPSSLSSGGQSIMPSFSRSLGEGFNCWIRLPSRHHAVGRHIRDELAATFKYGLFVAPFVATRAERLDSKAKKLQ